MKSRYCLLAALCVLVLPISVTAQVPTGPGRISGMVKSAEGAPLATVAVTLSGAADSALVTGVLTDAAGRFRIEGLQPGRYLLRVSTLGYRPRGSEVLELSLAEPHIDLGTIELEVAAVELDVLEASAEREGIVIEADRTTYNVKSMPIASSGTAIDVLRSVPELEVDVNNNVKLRGNQAVAVHLNGRPAPLRGEQLANFLQQLQGNRIDRVEVLPNPSAKHDPEGMGGIVNIVLRDDLDLGLSGSLTANASTQNRVFLNSRINYQKGRLTLFTGLGASTFSNTSTNWDLRRNLVTDPVTVIEQNSTSENRSLGWNMDWTAELRVGRQATLWSNAWMWHNGNDTDATTQYGITDDAEHVREHYVRFDDRENVWGNYNFGGGFKQIFQPQREELTIDGRLSIGRNDSNVLQRRVLSVLNGHPVDALDTYLLNDIDGGDGTSSLQADYFRPLGSGRLELGYRAWRREQDNQNQLHHLDAPNAPLGEADVRSGYDYAETAHSFYSTASRGFGKFRLQGGLRAEYTSTRFDSRVAEASLERSYTSLFPSVNLSWTPVPGRTARVLYSRRISRPSAFYLDPFVPPTDPLNRFFGNPELRPTYTDAYSMDFSYSANGTTLRVAPYHRRTSDIWERIRTVDADGVATSRWMNGRASYTSGSSFTVSLRPTGRLSGSTTFNLYSETRDGTNLGPAYRRTATMWSVGGNLGFKATPTLTMQAMANRMPMQSIVQGRASGYTFSSLSLRQQVWGTKGTIALNVNDPLDLMKFNSSSSDATYTQISRSSWRQRMAMLAVTYNFGKPPQQQSRRSGPEEAGETIRVR